MSLPISNAEHIYRSMRRSIINGESAPGERLLIRVLCEQFGTSSSPVIEAIRRLEQEGLVVSRQNAGAQVMEWSAQDVVRSYITREAMDGVAARLFVECATQEQRDKLVRLNEDYNQAARDEDVFRVREADTAYHLHIIKCTLPMPMQKAMESIYAITMTFFSNNPNITEKFVDGLHDRMTEVYVGNDAEAAEKYASESMRGALGYLVEKGIVERDNVPASIELKGGALVEA